MELLWEVLAFAAKGFVVLVVFVLMAAVLFRKRTAASGPERQGRFWLRAINPGWARAVEGLQSSLMPPKQFKQFVKKRRAERKAHAKDKSAPRVFVLDFKGDIMANPVESLRREVSALISVAQPADEVVVRLESPGGAAYAYGLAASQLARFKQNGLSLTVCVDRIAASGGYMMACVADRIVAAPFALIGSIGVAAPLPNVHRLLERVGVDYENATAGKYKRTVSFLAENTEEGRAKFQEQLEETHGLFKDFVASHRQQIDIDEVATGEFWHASRAQQLGLVDEIATSDDYLLGKISAADLYALTYRRPQTLRERVSSTAADMTESVLLRVWSRVRPEPHV